MNDGIVGLLDTDRVVAAIRERFGAPDVLFRNAGITHPGPSHGLHTTHNLTRAGDIAIFRGEPRRAADLYRQDYELSIGAGDYLDAAWDAGSASAALAYGNRLDEARRLAGQAQALPEPGGPVPHHPHAVPADSDSEFTGVHRVSARH